MLQSRPETGYVSVVWNTSKQLFVCKVFSKYDQRVYYLKVDKKLYTILEELLLRSKKPESVIFYQHLDQELIDFNATGVSVTLYLHCDSKTLVIEQGTHWTELSVFELLSSVRSHPEAGTILPKFYEVDNESPLN